MTAVSSTELRNTDDAEVSKNGIYIFLGTLLLCTVILLHLIHFHGYQVLENPVNMNNSVLEYIKKNRLYHFHRLHRRRRALRNKILLVGGTAGATLLMFKLFKSKWCTKIPNLPYPR